MILEKNAKLRAAFLYAALRNLSVHQKVLKMGTSVVETLGS
jgi:hypothetical protein